MDLVTLLRGLLTDPRVGVPIVLLAGATVVWFLLGSPAEPRRIGWERSVPDPDRDPVSRTFVALRRDAYSSVLLEVYTRLDTTLHARTGRRLGQIPWRTTAARRLGIPEPRELERTRIALDNLYVWAVRLETDSLLRRDFWRTWKASRAKFLESLAVRLRRVDGHLATLGYAP
ncbi:MAG TPA: hypothetical protein VJQ43_02815 [Thermoplasmata archaeon]|nr:hypothetical protein [Thermoplasmata archaeon]